ncbi:ABC transporter permease [Jiangella mangrovi]|uniref:ABC-2 type transport system permease protein n=1 Tax=Jiangella mangrovi TaxID=1524084 RepID=A0A7W9GSW2_9ACTN|nr:ABC transporter permease [Jiangella mangrovi]MBB5789438.1 ABC-2 type transport system permease protein [Jiangella mangrovi]
MSTLLANGGARRVRAIATAELRLLVRNRTAMFTALALPLITAGGLTAIGFGEEGDLSTGALVVTMLAGFTLLYVVYYNLVSAYVGRREDLVLKRLRVGELTDAEILAGTALPSVVVAVVQVVLTAVVVAVGFGLDAPVNVVLAVLALLAGVVMFVLLAAASTAFTRNVEMAQVSTLPVVFLCMGSLIFSGVVMPADTIPDTVQAVVRFIPLSPVVDMIGLGLTGQTADGDTVGFAASWGEAALPAVIAAAWIVVGVYALRRWFRWEPRT